MRNHLYIKCKMGNKINSIFRKYGKFEVIYLFVMVIYMGQATPETSRMVGTLSGNPIPLLLPIVLSYILCKKHHISFHNRNLHVVLIVYLVWAFCSIIKYGIYTTQELSYHFFMVYAIIIAYIHCQVYGCKFLPIYENIMVFLCKIAVFGWLIAVLLPFSTTFFRLFPETGFGNNVLYLFTWMDPAKGQVYSGILRNAGCSWEPGRFAIMVTLAMFCNLCQNGVKFKKNKNIWWLIIALITTQSTTGFASALILYTIFLIKKFNLKYIFILVIVMVPIIYGLFQLDFMGDKITDKLTKAQDVSRLYEQFDYYNANEDEGTYLGSIDRFDAMAFEWMNLIHDPILGYGRNFKHSFFYTEITTNYVLANGLVKILSSYGIFLGLFFFLILYKSSVTIANECYEKRSIGLFFIFILSAISYQVLAIPIFTSFWFYGLFKKNNRKIIYA